MNIKFTRLNFFYIYIRMLDICRYFYPFKVVAKHNFKCVKKETQLFSNKFEWQW